MSEITRCRVVVGYDENGNNRRCGLPVLAGETRCLSHFIPDPDDEEEEFPDEEYVPETEILT